MLPHDKYVMLKHIIKYRFMALFIMFFFAIIIPPLYFALNYDLLLPKAPIYRFVLAKLYHTQLRKTIPTLCPFRLYLR